MPLLRAEAVAKVYEPGSFWALRGTDLEIEERQVVAISGASGSGKSTLLHLFGGLDVPTSGRVLFRGQPLPTLDLSRYRARSVAFVFQSFLLLDTLTAAENVQLPLFESDRPRRQWRGHALELLDLVGMSRHADKLPSQMSGGERQRVAIARSLANEPQLLLADEPTGNLDTDNTHKILELLCRIHEQKGTSLILVTHDPVVAAYASRLVRLQDGRVVEDRPQTERRP